MEGRQTNTNTVHYSISLLVQQYEDQRAETSNIEINKVETSNMESNNMDSPIHARRTGDP